MASYDSPERQKKTSGRKFFEQFAILAAGGALVSVFLKTPASKIKQNTQPLAPKTNSNWDLATLPPVPEKITPSFQMINTQTGKRVV